VRRFTAYDVNLYRIEEFRRITLWLENSNELGAYLKKKRAEMDCSGLKLMWIQKILWE